MNTVYHKRLLLEKHPLGFNDEIEDVFFDLTRGIYIKIDTNKYNQFIFFFVDDKNIFQYNVKTGYFYCSYDMYWSIFESKYGLRYREVQSFTKNMAEEHLNLKEISPHLMMNNDKRQVEKNFKTKEIIPEPRAKF